MEKVAEVLVTGSDLARRATAGLCVNLASRESAAAKAFRKSAADGGVDKVLQAITRDPTTPPEVRDAAAGALQNLQESVLLALLSDSRVGFLFPVVIAGLVYMAFVVLSGS